MTPEDQAASANLSEVARRFLLSARGPGGLGAAQCDQLAALLETAAVEARVLAKACTALGKAAGEAKEALLRCRAPEGDQAAYQERQRVVGMLEDMVRGLADTDALRARWLAQALADTAKLPPHGCKPGVLNWRPEKGKR